MLDADDLRKTLECLTGDKLEAAEKERVVQKVYIIKTESRHTDKVIIFVTGPKRS
jgi:hypothetical protein